MPRSLADGKTKFSILVEKPVNPAAPTVTELNAGIDASCNVLGSDFTFGAAASDKINEAALCTSDNANTPTRSNNQSAFTFFRYFDDTGASAPTEGDDAFQAMKLKGVTVWAYARRTTKASGEDWEAADEIFHGAELVTDSVMPPSDMGGWTKYRQEAETQQAWPFIAVAAGA